MSILIEPSIRFFVEQQLRTSPLADWPPFTDPRPASEKELIVQLPKWWSYCQSCIISNIAFFYLSLSFVLFPLK